MFEIMAVFRVTNYCACNFSVTGHILQVSFHMMMNCVSDTQVKDSTLS
jgi:hypothetical protein